MGGLVPQFMTLRNRLAQGLFLSLRKRQTNGIPLLPVGKTQYRQYITMGGMNCVPTKENGVVSKKLAFGPTDRQFKNKKLWFSSKRAGYISARIPTIKEH